MSSANSLNRQDSKRLTNLIPCRNQLQNIYKEHINKLSSFLTKNDKKLKKYLLKNSIKLGHSIYDTVNFPFLFQSLKTNRRTSLDFETAKKERLYSKFDLFPLPTKSDNLNKFHLKSEEEKKIILNDERKVVASRKVDYTLNMKQNSMSKLTKTETMSESSIFKIK